MLAEGVLAMTTLLSLPHDLRPLACTLLTLLVYAGRFLWFCLRPGPALPALTARSFDALVPKIIGYRQVSDVTLLSLACVCSLKLITFDQPVAAVCPWDENLERLTP
jgi:hypothetical protein